MGKRTEKEAPFLQETQLLRAPGLVPWPCWGGSLSPPGAAEEGAAVRAAAVAVPEGSTLAWAPRGAARQEPRQLGVLCPMYPAVTARGAEAETRSPARGVQVRPALNPLLSEKDRVIREGKKEEEPFLPWDISSSAALPQRWWHQLSPALAWPDTVVPVPAPLWRGAEVPIPAVPFPSIPGEKPSTSISVAAGEKHTFAAQRGAPLLCPLLFWLPSVFV